MASISTPRAERIKRSLAQSTYITAAWTWFLVLAAKAAEQVIIGTPQVVFFAGRFIRAANSQSARNCGSCKLLVKMPPKPHPECFLPNRLS